MNVSFVVPCYRSAGTITEVVKEIENVMSTRNHSAFEIILVNDSSPDDTYSVIKKLCSSDKRVTGINLAKNFGQHAAIMAGMNMATGEVVVCLDDDGQTPADEVWKLLDKINEGYDVVYAQYRNKQHSGFRNMGSRMNSVMTEKLLGKPKELYISSYFAAKRFVVEEIIRYKNAYPYVIGLVLRTTDKICNVEVEHRKRKYGRSGYTFHRLISLWVNGFTAFSVKPLRTAAYCGSLTALFGFFYFVFTIVNKVRNPKVPLGWSSTMAVMLLIGGVVLVVLGIIGEYIGRIYLCINNSPQYVIREVTHNNQNEQ